MDESNQEGELSQSQIPGGDLERKFALIINGFLLKAFLMHLFWGIT
jgi:hypothetical protein